MKGEICITAMSPCYIGVLQDGILKDPHNIANQGQNPCHLSPCHSFLIHYASFLACVALFKSASTFNEWYIVVI